MGVVLFRGNRVESADSVTRCTAFFVRTVRGTKLAGSDVVKAESDSDEAESCDTSVEAVSADTLEVVNMVHNAAGDLDNFFFPAKNILRVFGF